jgi:cytochrome c-type biogenesis protein CcmH/NrfG
MVEAWFNLGLALYQEQRWVEGCEAFGKAVDLKPTQPNMYFQYAEAL